jgi:hypothetical protein
MTLGYSKPLYLLAFDHRVSFERDLFNARRPITDEVRAGIIDAKEVIYEGFVEASGRGVPTDAAGILVEEQYRTGVARKATDALATSWPGRSRGLARPGSISSTAMTSDRTRLRWAERCGRNRGETLSPATSTVEAAVNTIA